MCPPVRLSVRHKPVLYWNDWTNRDSFGMGGLFLPILHCVIRVFGYLQNKSTSLWNSAPNYERRKFRHGKSIALSTKLNVDGRACWRHLYDSRRVVAVYYKSVSCNPLTPLLRFVVDLLYNLFAQLCNSRQDSDWHGASRGPSAVAELLVYLCCVRLPYTMVN